MQQFDDGGWTPYQHTPLPGPRFIRVLELLPGPSAAPVSIKLRAVHLDESPSYECLSYEWGLPVRSVLPDIPGFADVEFKVELRHKRPVYCNDGLLLIMVNLHTLLTRLRRTHRSRFFWADAICINQDDPAERNEQVLLMADIYEQAARVNLWLGEAKAGTKMAYTLAEELALCYDERQLPEGATREHLEGLVTIDPSTVELLKGYWEAVVDVFTREAFGRVWIVQEIVLAKKLDVLCGEHTLPWPSFLAASRCIVSLGLVVDKAPFDTQYRLPWDRLRSLGTTKDVRQGLPRVAGTNSLHELAERFLGHTVTDPRDRIYGMLSIITPESEHGRTAPIEPDYNKPAEQVYQQACEWSFRDSWSLAMLALCHAPATNAIPAPRLPTWVPDLSKGPPVCPLPHKLPHSGTLLSLLQDQFRWSVTGKKLRVHAQIVDVISLARSPCTERTKHLVQMEQFHLFALDSRSYPAGGGTALEALWRTFLTNGVRDKGIGLSRVAPAEFGVHFAFCMAREMLRQLRLPERLTGAEADIQDTADPNTFFSLYRLCPGDVESNISIPALQRKHPFIQLLYDSLGAGGDGAKWVAEIKERDFMACGDRGRQFLVTDRGFMGLGPVCPPGRVNEDGDVVLPAGSGVRKGDVVAVIAGSDQPWILRKGRDASDGSVYTIVGDAYVHGVTEGSCFAPGEQPVMEPIVLV